MEVDSSNDHFNGTINANNSNWVNNYDNLDFGDSEIAKNNNAMNVVNNSTINNGDEIAFILCPLCQTPIKPNAVNLCIQCLNSRYDISQGISRELIIFQCRQCLRWYKNPQWIAAQLESGQLLEILLKKVSGINKKTIKLVDASFVWTEPHSRRLKIKVTIQKEVMNNAIVEKTFEIEFMIENQQCKECQRSFTHHTWKACIQLRQKVDHKRTFLFLEQLILKYNMGLHCIGIKEQKDGIDFFFDSKSASRTFMAFLHSIIILQQRPNRESKRLVSHDHKSNIASYKYTFCAELPPICRNDLVLIPLKLQKKCGGKSPLMICHKITTVLHFVEPTTLHTIDLDAKQYFKYHFAAISSVKHLSVFYVMALTPLRNLHRGKWKCAELELVRENDLGDDNAPILETITHIGGLLKEGDMVLGYDLLQLSSHNDLENDENLKKYLKKSKIPDVIVVKKHYPYYSKSTKRKWKLKSMVKEREYNVDKYHAEKEQKDNELFMREIEQDFDLRCMINVYKDDNNNNAFKQNGNGNDEIPQIPDSELIDEFAEMKVAENGTNAMMNDEDEDDDDIINID